MSSNTRIFFPLEAFPSSALGIPARRSGDLLLGSRSWCVESVQICPCVCVCVTVLVLVLLHVASDTGPTARFQQQTSNLGGWRKIPVRGEGGSGSGQFWGSPCWALIGRRSRSCWIKQGSGNSSRADPSRRGAERRCSRRNLWAQPAAPPEAREGPGGSDRVQEGPAGTERVREGPTGTHLIRIHSTVHSDPSSDSWTCSQADAPLWALVRSSEA